MAEGNQSQADIVVRVAADVESAAKGIDGLLKSIQTNTKAGAASFGFLDDVIGGHGKTIVAALANYTALGRAGMALASTLGQAWQTVGEVVKSLGGEEKFGHFEEEVDSLKQSALSALGAVSTQAGDGISAMIVGDAAGNAASMEAFVDRVVQAAISTTRTVRVLLESALKPEDRSTEVLQMHIDGLLQKMQTLDRALQMHESNRGSQWVDRLFGSDTPALLRRQREEVETEIMRLGDLVSGRIEQMVLTPIELAVTNRSIEDAIQALRRQNEQLEIQIHTFGMAAGAAARYRAELEMLRLYSDEDGPRGPLWDANQERHRREADRQAEMTQRLADLQRGSRGGGNRLENIFLQSEGRTQQLEQQARALTMAAGASAALAAEERILLQLRQAQIEPTEAIIERIKALAAAEGQATTQLRDMQRQMGFLNDVGRSVSSSLERAFGDFITGTETDWNRLFQGLVRDLATLALRTWVLQPLFGGGAGGGTGLLQSLFTPSLPGRASGGPVRAGWPYMVGEHGPEPFVPAVNGFILPAGSRAGGEGARVTVNNYAPAQVEAGERDDGELEITVRSIARDEFGSERMNSVMTGKHGINPRVRQR